MRAPNRVNRIGKLSLVMLVSSTLSHALAWAVYLVVAAGLVIWPLWQGEGGDDPRVLATVFAPVALSGLGLSIVVGQGRRADGNSMSAILAVLLTVFCVLAIFAVAMLHLPVAIKLAIGLLIAFYPIALTLGAGRGIRSFLLGVTVILLLGFCAMASLSVGIFFLPSALAMAVATVASLLAQPSPRLGGRQKI